MTALRQARLVEWLGGSIMVVIDANTSSYVEDPSQLNVDAVQKDKTRIERFFDDLATGRVPHGISTQAAAAAAAAAKAAQVAAELQRSDKIRGRKSRAKKKDTNYHNRYDDLDGLSLFTMADDGTGQDIQVSSVFVSANQGARIVQSLALTRKCNHMQSSVRLSFMAEMVMRAPSPGSSSSSSNGNLTHDDSKITFPLSALSKANIVPKNLITQIQQGLQGAVSQVGAENNDETVDVKSNL